MKTWTNVDKNNWLDGPWKEEPDKAQWIDETTKLDCLIVRNTSGSLCGYVGVPETYNSFSVDCNKIDVEVHGGLTFSSYCNEDEKIEKSICHIGTIANKLVWWFGFDCAHCFDLTPCPMMEEFKTKQEIYRTFKYVKEEVKSLALQLKNLH